MFTTDSLKAVPEMHYDITPPGRFLNINESWNSIVDIKKRVTVDGVVQVDKVLATHAHEMIDLYEKGIVIGK